ncbi:MAG: OsmC family protein [Rectinemataceae bacterium]
MKHEVTTVWKGGMGFEADIGGHKLAIDLAEADGGKNSGPRPKPLLLAALAGCSGMDVVSILEKMREPCTWFEMHTEATPAEDHPKRYTMYRMTYRFKKSDNLDEAKVRKAVTLSQDKYCGVAATLKASAPLEWDIEFV